MIDDEIEQRVGRGDLDGLVVFVDALTSERDWDRLVVLRDRCRAAGYETGRQLWPIASLAEYRLALRAPGPWAAGVVLESTGRFVLGPLTEVAASTHAWAELSPHLDGAPAAAYVAHERVVRGEDLTADSSVDTNVLELPLALQTWEPSYSLATYHDDRIETPAPAPPARSAIHIPARVDRLDDADVANGFRDLVAPWVAHSNGRCDVAVARGDHRHAIAALGVPAARAGAIEPAQALAWLAWAGASGGAFGNRRGMAAGRWEAWWLAATIAGRRDDWPLAPRELGQAIGALRWWIWDANEPVTGWSLRLAAHAPERDVAWAVAAIDAS